jgi:L-fuculose-phosphate aldolase
MNENLSLSITHPAELIIIAIRRLYDRGLTTTSGGNISIMDENGDTWVTPASVDKGSLDPADISRVRQNGEITGIHKPSSEYPFHEAIYKARPDIKSVIHAHPPALVSFSIVGQIPDTNIIPQAKNICGPIAMAKYAIPGSKKLGENIAGEFGKGFNAVIMENHGIVIGGSTIEDAFNRFETLEFCARTIINARNLSDTYTRLTDDQISRYEADLECALPSMEKAVHEPDEKKLRSMIVNIVHRACRQGLMISTYGTVSARWTNNDFLITPTGISRWDLVAGDIVQVKDGHRESEKSPSRSADLHQAIYREFPGVNSIITTQPPFLMAYGITARNLDVRIIPESWIMLQNVCKVPFGSNKPESGAVMKLLGQKINTIIIENDAVLVTGSTLLQAYDRLEVAEFSAKSLNMGSSLGNVVLISEESVNELKAKFLQ